jgi:hypothetical protein
MKKELADFIVKNADSLESLYTSYLDTKLDVELKHGDSPALPFDQWVKTIHQIFVNN